MAFCISLPYTLPEFIFKHYTMFNIIDAERSWPLISSEQKQDLMSHSDQILPILLVGMVHVDTKARILRSLII
jgi:hypothetical protein